MNQGRITPGVAIIVLGVVVLGQVALGPVVAQQQSDEAGEEEPRTVRRLGDVIGAEGEDFSMDLPAINLPQEPVEPQPEVSLPDPALDSTLQDILSRRAFAPDSTAIEAELSVLLDQAEARAGQALAAGELDLAARWTAAIVAFQPDRPIIARVDAARQRQAEIELLLEQAEAALAAENWLQPGDASAWGLFSQVQALDRENQQAEAGLAATRDAIAARIDGLLAEANFEAAAQLLDQWEAVAGDTESIQALRQAVTDAREAEKVALVERTENAIENERYDRAETLINEMIALGVESERIERLRAALGDAMRYGGFQPGQLFQDPLQGRSGNGPVMVVIPSGSFMMGSPQGEDGRADNEGPRFRVTFDQGFALSRTEVTVGQFRAFVEATGYLTDAERDGSSNVYMVNSGRIDTDSSVSWRDDFRGRPADENLPVIHVSFRDARAYVEWLARQTQRPYRLPSEAEFEYALRAGSQTRYWWGDQEPSDPIENVAGARDSFPDDRRRWNDGFRRYDDGFWGPAPVASLQASPFGLFDMGGNVMEWVEDCWHSSYVRAPTDGSAWVNPGCDRRVIRGAAWSSVPSLSRSALRLTSRETNADARVGFRVARDL